MANPIQANAWINLLANGSIITATRDQFPNVIAGRGYVTLVQIRQGYLILQEGASLRLGINELEIPPQYTQSQEWYRLQPTSAIGVNFGHGENYNRFRTNAMRCGTLVPPGMVDEEEALGIFPLATLFNSSCAPNVHAHWNLTAQRMEFRAARDIQPREELCICYNVDTMLFRRQERRQQLGQLHGFLCACSICNQRGATQQISDVRRQGLRSMVTNGGGDIEEILRAISDLQHEGINHFIDGLLYDAYLALKDSDTNNNAMLYLRRARDWARDMVGAQDNRVLHMTQRLPPHLR